MMAKGFKERIERVQEYFQGMELYGGVLIVKVKYKHKWGVFNSKDDLVKVAKSEDAPNEYFYYGDYEAISFDDIFDLIEETIDVNLSAAAKLELLQEKFDELKELFGKEPLDKLKTLYFAFSAPLSTVRKRGRKSGSTKKKKTPEAKIEAIEETVETAVPMEPQPQEEQINVEANVIG